MGANLRFTCPVEGCGYTAGFRLSMGEEDMPEEHSKRYEIPREEHPNHPAPAPNRKPKDIDTENQLAQDGELNF